MEEGEKLGRWIHGRKIIQSLKSNFIGFIEDWPICVIKRYYETKSQGVIRNDIKENKSTKA